MAIGVQAVIETTRTVTPRGTGSGLALRPAHLAVIGAGSLLAVVMLSLGQSIAAPGDLGIDYMFYRDVGARWLTDGSFYLAHQLAGPYDIALMVDVL